jgi:hypothetical protein
MAANSSPTSLQFGDERFFYGNIKHILVRQFSKRYLILELTLDYSTQQQIQQEVKIYQQTHLILK